jgi:hypothetical protein
MARILGSETSTLVHGVPRRIYGCLHLLLWWHGKLARSICESGPVNLHACISQQGASAAFFVTSAGQFQNFAVKYSVTYVLMFFTSSAAKEQGFGGLLNVGFCYMLA